MAAGSWLAASRLSCLSDWLLTMAAMLCCAELPQEAWAFDDGKNFLTAHRLKLRGTMQLPLDMHSKLAVTVRGVPVAGKGKNADWQVRRRCLVMVMC